MATSLLRIDCSLKACGTLSRRMGDQALRALSGDASDARVTQRVLAVDPVAPVDAGFTASMITHQAAEMARAPRGIPRSRLTRWRKPTRGYSPRRCVTSLFPRHLRLGSIRSPALARPLGARRTDKSTFWRIDRHSSSSWRMAFSATTGPSDTLSALY